MPFVTIVLPTYQRLAYLQDAIGSVLAQTFTDWELIVVDDGSTDGSLEWLRSIADERITVIATTHSGNPSRLRNLGAAHGSGEWIAFLDSDDLWTAEKLARQAAALANNSRSRWSCTGVSFVDDSGAVIPQRAGASYRAHSGWILEKLLTFEAAATMPTLMVQRSLFDEVGAFDESVLLREDYDLELRLAARAEIHALSEPLTIVREHDGRTSSRRRVTDLHRANEMVMRRFEDSTTSARVRAICRRQRSAQLVQQARLHSLDGDHRAALATAAKAIGVSPLDSLPWRSAAGCSLRWLRLK
jgi:glycosyltransferase involved in cell wall biosynthesis